MITIEQVGARHVEGPSTGGGAVRRAPVHRPVTRDRRGPARPIAVHARGGAACPSPAVGRRSVPARSWALPDVVRRVTAGVGLAVASAVAVIGLGLLSDLAAPDVPAATPVTVVGQR